MKQFMELEETIEALATESRQIFDSFLDEHLGLMPGLDRSPGPHRAVSAPQGVATSRPTGSTWDGCSAGSDCWTGSR